MNRAFFILGIVFAIGIKRQRAGTSDRNRILALHVEALAQWRNRSGGHALRKIFIVDIGDVVNTEAAFARSGIEVLAAQLQIEHFVAAMLVDFLKLILLRSVLLVPLRIRNLVKIAADDRRRLVSFRDGDGFESARAIRDVGESS